MTISFRKWVTRLTFYYAEDIQIITGYGFSYVMHVKKSANVLEFVFCNL